MSNKELNGLVVAHKKLGNVKIVEVNDTYIVCESEGKNKIFKIEQLEQYFDLNKDVLEKILKISSELKAIIKAEEDKKKAELERKAAEEAKRKAELEKILLDKSKRERIETEIRENHPSIHVRRKDGKSQIFLVCQNNNFDIESEHDFIWVPMYQNKANASHDIIEYIKIDDIIFHHFENHIHAISIVKSDLKIRKPPIGHVSYGIEGRSVDTVYHVLSTKVDTSKLKRDKASYGSVKYGPFDKRGNNKQGFYLSELNENLASIFIDACIKTNPGDKYLLDIKKLI